MLSPTLPANQNGYSTGNEQGDATGLWNRFATCHAEPYAEALVRRGEDAVAEDEARV